MHIVLTDGVKTGRKRNQVKSSARKEREEIVELNMAVASEGFEPTSNPETRSNSDQTLDEVCGVDGPSVEQG